MKTSQPLAVCIECGAMWLVSQGDRGEMLLIKPGKKKPVVVTDDKCPLCHAWLITDDYATRYTLFAVERDEARHYRRLMEDWQDKATHLQGVLDRREHDIKSLQAQLDAGHNHQVVCVVCGVVMSVGTSPRKKRYCSDKCRKKAERNRKKYQ